jgi:hypothetical protein
MCSPLTIKFCHSSHLYGYVFATRHYDLLVIIRTSSSGCTVTKLWLVMVYFFWEYLILYTVYSGEVMTEKNLIIRRKIYTSRI